MTLNNEDDTRYLPPSKRVAIVKVTDYFGPITEPVAFLHRDIGIEFT